MKDARGPWLRDLGGRRFLDGTSSLWVNVFGHRDPGLDRAVLRQLKRVAHSTFLGASHPPAIRLARELVRLAGPPLRRVFFSDNGSTAVEVALKMAFQHARTRGGAARKEFVAVQGSYHGDTLGSVSVGGIRLFHERFRPLLFKTHFAMSPHCARCRFNKRGVRHRLRLAPFRRRPPHPGDLNRETGCRWECLGSLRDILGRRGRRIAGGILEPAVQAAAGMRVLPPGYAKGWERLCRNSGVLTIADEVATGFGRTGELWASRLEGIRPDFLCLAKSITGGYLPLAATLTTERIYEAFLGRYDEFKTFFHGHTYTANPLACAAALEAVGRMSAQGFVAGVRRRAARLAGSLEKIRGIRGVWSVRQVGLMAGIEIVEEPESGRPCPPSERIGRRICLAARERGVWLRPLGDCIVLMPPLMISKRDLDRIVQAVGGSVKQVMESRSSRRLYNRHENIHSRNGLGARGARDLRVPGR